MSGLKVFLKLENLQQTGSFKLRGATWKIEGNLANTGVPGLVAASAGNHAQGVALAANRAGLPATIIMPVWASISKQEATRGYGGMVVLEGQCIDDSIRYAMKLSQAGLSFIHPFDDLDIITGQATVGLEIMEELPETDIIVVPVGGGGLIAGIASAAKALKPTLKVIGAESDACPSCYEAVKRGEPTQVEAEPSLADGIAVRKLGSLTFPVIRELVNEVRVVSEEQIAKGILLLLERKKLLAEGAGAVPVAALLYGKPELRPGSTVVLVISGGNVDSPLLDRVIRKGLFEAGRMLRLSILLDDRPGTLAALLGHIAGLEANVLNIRHFRSERDLPVHLSRVELELETRGPGHAKTICEQLRIAGVRMSTCSVEDAAS